MWNNWLFKKKHAWTRNRGTYTNGDRQFSWGKGDVRTGTIYYLSGPRALEVYWELGSWSVDLCLYLPQGPWVRGDGSTEPVTEAEQSAIVRDIYEALSEHGYKVKAQQ